ncbi:unnamed protein product, partial [Porites evermanni]
MHGIPENIYTSTEEVVLKVAEAVNVPVAAEDIEISHKLRQRNGMKPIIVKFCSHKVKSRLYKERTKLKSVKISDLSPSYASAATKQNRIFINENLTPYRADLVRQANDMKADGLLSSVWTLDGKVFVKTSPSGNPNLCTVIVSNTNTSKVIIVGDWNTTLHSIDKYGGRPWFGTNYRNLLLHFMDELGLVDAYRALHPKRKVFTYESKPLKLKSRIDLFIISQSLKPNIRK